MKFILPYHLTDEEYVVFNDHHLRHTPFGRKIVRNCRLGLIALSLLLLLCFWLWHQDGFVFICQLIGVSIVCILGMLFFRRSMLTTLRRRVRRSHKTGTELFSVKGELTIDFAQKIIIDKTEKITLETPFSSIQQFYETDTAFYLYFQPQGGFILPYRLFLSTDELTAFRENARAAFQ